MFIERTSKEIIIHLPASIDLKELQDVLDFARYKELVSKFKVSQKKIDKLASDINKSWWKKNRKKLMS
jgi:hypothetical protein